MKSIQTSLNNREVCGRYWKYEGRKVGMATEQKEYPPAVFMRISKAKTSLYGFVPTEGITGGKTLVMNRADLIKLLKKEVEFVKVGILEPSGKKETKDTDRLEG